jgi:RimJ/RimL family protein N-acetyltransferase
MPTVEILQTPRLMLRPFVPEDREAMIALQGDAEVMRFYGNGEALSAAQVDIVLDAHIHCREKAYWAWAVALREYPMPPTLPACFGQITAVCVEWHSEQWIELCWLLLPGRWRQGFATEGVQAVLQHGTTALGWRKVMAGADVRNVPSLRVMIKNGMVFDREEKDSQGRMRRIHTLVKKGY